MAELQRASVFAIKEETTTGTLVEPSAAGDFIPLRTGFALTPNLEELTSDEIINDIGPAKSLTGKESPEGTHNVYLKHSETEGQAPEYGLLIESAMGAKTVNATEYDTVAGSTTSVVNVDSGEGANFEEGQALLIKDATNGYSIRNVDSISTDALTVAFDLDNAPGTGVNLGKAVLYKPATSGHPSYSSWLYTANGAAKQAVAGCRTSAIEMNMTAAQQAEINFTYTGSEYFFNPIVITSSNKYLDFDDGGGEENATMEEKAYKSPIELAREIQTKMDALTTDNITVTYSSTTGKYTIASDGGTFSLLWNTGTNTANTIGSDLGFTVTADDTGATTYTSDSALDFSASYTPDYDDATNIVVKEAELMIGDDSDNVCRKASVVTFSIATPTTDIDSICSSTGLDEKLILSRECTMSATLILEKYEVGLFDKFLNNTTTQIMANIGAKSGGNWVAGKCINIFMQNASITAHNVVGDEFAQVELTAKGFVSSTAKDCYINFI